MKEQRNVIRNKNARCSEGIDRFKNYQFFFIQLETT